MSTSPRPRWPDATPSRPASTGTAPTRRRTSASRGAIPFTGSIDFDNDANNPLDTGFGYANAALGVFSEYSQQSKFIEGGYRYKNVEWFLQDNWKLNSRITLDYGLRFTHQQPQHDSLLQASNFFPDSGASANAPLLYVPGCTVAASPCPSANRVAVNPASGASLGAGQRPGHRHAGAEQRRP